MDLEIGEVRVEIGRLLDELQMRAFIFTVEPKGDLWQLRVECATDGEWQTVSLPIEAPQLLSRLRDPTERERFKALLRGRLRECAKLSG
jgi:hypothetical protein